MTPGIVTIKTTIRAGDKFAIRLAPDLGEGTFGLYRPDGELAAHATSPRLLSEMAMSAGAQEVRHDYDLVAEHSRFHRG